MIHTNFRTVVTTDEGNELGRVKLYFQLFQKFYFLFKRKLYSTCSKELALLKPGQSLHD